MWCTLASWDGRAGFQNFPPWPHKNQQTGAKATPLSNSGDSLKIQEEVVPTLTCSEAFLSTGKQSFIYLNIDCALLFASPMASSWQCLHLFAEGSLWPSKPIEPMQGKPEVPTSSSPGSSPSPVAGGRWWMKTRFLASWGHVQHEPQNFPVGCAQ